MLVNYFIYILYKVILLYCVKNFSLSIDRICQINTAADLVENSRSAAVFRHKKKAAIAASFLTCLRILGLPSS